MFRKRPLWCAFTTAVLVAGCLFAARAANSGKNERPVPGGPSAWRLMEPIQYENLIIFPVVSSQSANTTGFATLDDALAAGEAVVTEGGVNVIRRTRDGRPVPIPQQQGASVNQLVLINRGSKPLVLLAGEMVSGGKQDRIISKDRIVPPGADPIPLDVFCVEQSRWTGGAQFSAGKIMVHPSVREKAAVDQEQTKVWAAVRNGTTSESGMVAGGAGVGVGPGVASGSGGGVGSGSGGGIGGGSYAPPTVSARRIGEVVATEAPTGAYQKIYKSKQVSNTVDPFVDEIQRRFARQTAGLKGESVVGVVIAYGGELAWSDIFASGEMFARYWPKLLPSYVVEALARPRTTEQASLDDAREFLRPLTGHETAESEPGAYRLTQVTQGRYVEIELEALRPANIKLHTLKIHRTS
jgi:hypothetical protein